MCIRDRDLAAIDTAMAELNTAFQAASAEMYAQSGAQGGAQAGPGAGCLLYTSLLRLILLWGLGLIRLLNVSSRVISYWQRLVAVSYTHLWEMVVLNRSCSAS